MKYSFFSLKNDTPKTRALNVLFGFIVVALLYIAYEYLEHKHNFGIPCLFHTVTGLYCPGCGITRGIEALLRLDMYQAFRYNALLIPAAIFFIICLTDQLVNYIRKKPTWFYHKIPKFLWISFLVIAVLFGILRNISHFDFLIPTKV